MGGLAPSALLLPLCSQTSIGGDRIQVLTLYAQDIAGTEAEGELRIDVPTGISQAGSAISITSAAGACHCSGRSWTSR